MANPAPSVSLTNAGIARKAREVFAKQAAQILAELVVSVRARLNELLDKPASAAEMQDNRDAWQAYQKAEADWIRGVHTEWKKGILAPNPSLSSKATLAMSSFELVGNEVVESKILSSRLALRILDKSSWEFNDLTLRMRQLENVHEMDKLDILRPEAFAQLIVEQWMAVNLTRESWLAVQPVIHKAFGERLVEAYHATNAYLISSGVMADIDLRGLVKRTPSNSGVAPLSQDAAGDTSAEHAITGQGHGGRSGASSVRSGMPTARGQAAGAQAADDASRLPTADYANQGRSASAGVARAPVLSSAAARAAVARYAEEASQETRMMTSTTPLARAKMRAQGVIGQLKRMLTDKVVGFDDTRGGAPSPQLEAAMAQRSIAYQQTQAAPYAGGANGAVAAAGAGYVQFVEGMRPDQAAGALREQTNTLKKAASTTAEKATIEIVALMFQSILAEDRIPATVRVWFARLQMPVLRLALAEPDFFESLQHPARRLIDRMGSCVLGFEADVSSAALETEIKRVVQVIEQYPETGRRVFQLVYDEFVKFLSKFLSEQGSTQRIVSVAQQMEQKETAAIQYTIEMRKILGDMPVRDEIREFLFKIWTEVMAIASIKNGSESETPLALRQTAADLVWAASAKPDRNDRAKVIQDLPSLLKRLRLGMALLGYETTKQNEQIKIISDTLAAAFMSKTETINPQQIADMAKRLKNLEDYVSDDDVGDLPLDAESMELMLGIDISGIDIITSGGSDPTEAMRGWAKELDLGNWFNLDHNGKTGRIQYAWCSKRGQLHLFAGANGRTYLFQLRRLAAYLQAGLMTPVEDEALTVRATRDALTKLDANPERLLAA